jgi:hypothetical protein
MDVETVRQRADAFCEALLAGDIGRASEEFSQQLKSNIGEVVSQFPLPLTEAAVESVEVAGSGYLAVLHLTGETDEIRMETRWKDRDGRPTMVEASHVIERAVAPPAEEGAEAGAESEG